MNLHEIKIEEFAKGASRPSYFASKIEHHIFQILDSPLFFKLSRTIIFVWLVIVSGATYWLFYDGIKRHLDILSVWSWLAHNAHVLFVIFGEFFACSCLFRGTRSRGSSAILPLSANATSNSSSSSSPSSSSSSSSSSSNSSRKGGIFSKAQESAASGPVFSSLSSQLFRFRNIERFAPESKLHLEKFSIAQRRRAIRTKLRDQISNDPVHRFIDLWISWTAANFMLGIVLLAQIAWGIYVTFLHIFIHWIPYLVQLFYIISVRRRMLRLSLDMWDLPPSSKSQTESERKRLQSRSRLILLASWTEACIVPAALAFAYSRLYDVKKAYTTIGKFPDWLMPNAGWILIGLQSVLVILIYVAWIFKKRRDERAELKEEHALLSSSSFFWKASPQGPFVLQSDGTEQQLGDLEMNAQTSESHSLSAEDHEELLGFSPGTPIGSLLMQLPLPSHQQNQSIDMMD